MKIFRRFGKPIESDSEFRHPYDPKTGAKTHIVLLRNMARATALMSLFAVVSIDQQQVAIGQPLGTTPEIKLEIAVREDGTATPHWVSGTAISLGQQAAENAARQELPLKPQAQAWLQVLQGALPMLVVRAEQLAEALNVPPVDAIVVAGNRASSDAFGWLPNNIGINVQAFVDSYGPPDEEAMARMVRITAHEYIHLLTYAFYPNHRELRETPLDRALWTMFFEGIGDYVSVSNRWLPDSQANYSPIAAGTLETLEPILVDRLEKLVDASSAAEKELRKRISMGKFDEKWGSLPVALWLHQEVKKCGEAETLPVIFRLQRDAVLLLASRHAAPELRSRLSVIQMSTGRSPRKASEAYCIASLRKVVEPTGVPLILGEES